MAEPSDPPSTTKVFTAQDISKHNTSDDLWTIIGNDIYDLTDFQKEHPGGAKVLQGVAGKDATKKFRKYHRDALLLRYQEGLRIGELVSQPQGRRWFFFKASVK